MTVQISDGVGGVDTQAIAVKVENVVGVSIIGTPINDLIDATHTVAGQPFPTNEEDTLNGGTGADRMSGGQGDDAYVVDNPGDVVIENANDGVDTVNASIHYGLTPNVENLTLQGNADLQGYGNVLANTIIGNSGSNLINGGAGTDTMVGRGGDDFYFVDDVGDTVIENGGGGSDTVFSTAHFRLSANVENLILQGSADLQGYGNSQSNVIYGNSGNNLIDGGGGVDLMVGEAGNDIYFVDDTSDAAFENPGEGNDVVFASAHYGLAADVETLVLQGSADLQGYGNNQANVTLRQCRQQPHQRQRAVSTLWWAAPATTPISSTIRATPASSLRTRATMRCSRFSTTGWPRTSRPWCCRGAAISRVTATTRRTRSMATPGTTCSTVRAAPGCWGVPATIPILSIMLAI